MLSRAIRARAILNVQPLTTQCRRYAAAPPTELKKTPLYDLHVRSGAKMVPFAGYSMPITYADQGISESHNHVRTKAGLFDVSHMVQHIFEGPDSLEFLHRMTPSDLLELKMNHSTLSVFLHPITGGIVDDVMITRTGPESFFVVTNAGCAEKDLEYINENLEEFSTRGNSGWSFWRSDAKQVKHTVLRGHGLVALQGPVAGRILSEFFIRSMGTTQVPDLRNIFFGTSIPLDTLSYGPLLISRGGYTGEDGFEISINRNETEAVVKQLLDIGRDHIKLTGLGARDTLRLEAGMCLYGHDLDDATTPIEAGLKWLIGSRRIMEGGFNGVETVGRQYNDWKLVEKRRVGFVIEGAPAREGAEIVDPETKEVIGKITSGCPSPTLGKNIAMGYVKSGLHKSGTELTVMVRGKPRKAVVTKMPFVPTNYYKGS
ncbi:hypothetical protein EDC01DRAFT_730728 [Geopyxis carbonaria]|nr:hypothetical protein EDC01DRAFT_730728 [Geopyxis carbonaria]